jgi:hypothetical protein
MDLAETVKQHYSARFSELPTDKQFHFASRLAAWQNDALAISKLEQLAAYMVPDGSGLKAALQKILDEKSGLAYAYELRRPYFQKYPQLFGIHNAMFRVRHLKEFYGVDARDELVSLVGKDVLSDLYREICRDEPAIRTLSRFAIDYIYLYEIMFEKSRGFDPERLLGIASGYDSNSLEQTHLLIYLYTHAVIADSNFYARNVPEERLELYRALLQELESLLDNRPDIKFDNRFEFLVAARICGFDSRLSDGINRDARQSLDPTDSFIIDKLNGPADVYLNSFAGSEHRNVLYIMSQSAYQPKNPPADPA